LFTDEYGADFTRAYNTVRFVRGFAFDDKHVQELIRRLHERPEDLTTDDRAHLESFFSVAANSGASEEDLKYLGLSHSPKPAIM
jgi:hypothetical protein